MITEQDKKHMLGDMIHNALFLYPIDMEAADEAWNRSCADEGLFLERWESMVFETCTHMHCVGHNDEDIEEMHDWLMSVLDLSVYDRPDPERV